MDLVITTETLGSNLLLTVVTTNSVSTKKPLSQMALAYKAKTGELIGILDAKSLMGSSKSPAEIKAVLELLIS